MFKVFYYPFEDELLELENHCDIEDLQKLVHDLDKDITEIEDDIFKGSVCGEERAITNTVQPVQIGEHK